MNKEQAQQYIERKIPITKNMGMTINALSGDEVRVGLPLAPNVNHQGSAFGGSMESLFFVTGWAYVQWLIKDIHPEPKIVGRRARSAFHKPVKEDFEAILSIPSKSDSDTFLKDLKEKGKGRITAKAEIVIQGELCAEFEGDFVVLKTKNEP